MGMKINRNTYCFFQCFDKLCCLVRKKESCHILDTDRISSHFLNTFGNSCPVFQCICISKGIGKSYLSMNLFLVCCLNCSLKITKIVKTVKNTDDINTVSCRFLHKIFYNIICIRTISKNILSTEKHLKFCMFKSVT